MSRGHQTGQARTASAMGPDDLQRDESSSALARDQIREVRRGYIRAYTSGGLRTLVLVSALISEITYRAANPPLSSRSAFPLNRPRLRNFRNSTYGSRGRESRAASSSQR